MINSSYGLIYETTNLLNGKKYIGQTTKVKKYFDNKYFGSGVHLIRDIEKIGILNFQTQPLDYAKNQKELDDLEVKYIQERKSCNPFGYNIAKGGNKENKLEFMSDESKRERANKISQKNKIKRPKKKTIFSDFLENINTDCENEDDYIKIYIKHINYLANLPSGLEGLIYELLKNMNYGNKIVINSFIKEDIARNIGKTFNTINQYITKLVESKILIREARGVYYLNPLFYGKGKWKDIADLREKLMVSVIYEDGKYTINHC